MNNFVRVIVLRGVIAKAFSLGSAEANMPTDISGVARIFSMGDFFSSSKFSDTKLI